MNDLDIINRQAAAASLRRLADRIEIEQVRIVTIEHQVWNHNKSEWLTIKWEDIS